MLDRQNRILGHEPLFRGSEDNSAEILDDLHTSACVIRYAFGDAGIASALRNGPRFVNVDEKLRLGGRPPPLSRMAARRGPMREILAEQTADAGGALCERAFMTGILSLLDALFHQPTEALLNEISLTPNVRAALLRRTGILGYGLALGARLEQKDSAGGRRFVWRRGGEHPTPRAHTQPTWKTDVGRRFQAFLISLKGAAHGRCKGS
ncbi:MAG: hypothetical protein M0T84_05975 [Betaproteobacteria bacterium]|nr:hypothetical protein [Betaproteobacteria bacterium]